ncbi:MAG: hypothetical protein WC635_09610 [Bacteriovorax sp.]|jgi:hypothetical protein
MLKKLQILFLFFVFIFRAQALDVVLMGGGGEPPALNTTIFDNALENFADAKTRINANVQVSFNGNHSVTKAIIENKIKVQHTSFTKENYEKLVASTLTKITSGAIPKGGQLMVIIDTHGGTKEPPHKTHSIAMSDSSLSDMTYIRGSGSDSVDRLKVLAEAAEKHGVKLAILDMSCHSGNSLALANTNTCVVSSTGDKHFGYGAFTQALYDQIKPGASLEEAFLKARLDSYDQGFPMISSPVGKEMNERLYSLFTPYLYQRHDSNADKITSYIKQVAQCENRDQRDSDFDKLLTEVNGFEKIAGVARSRFLGEALLKEELIAYKKLQDQMLDDLSKLNYRMLSKVETISYPSGNTSNKKKNVNVTENISIGDILDFPHQNLIYLEDRLVVMTKEKYSKSEIDDTKTSINKIKTVLKRQEELKKSQPELLETTNVFSRIDDQSALIMGKASMISELARKIYDQNYRQEMKMNKMPNPCTDFKF